MAALGLGATLGAVLLLVVSLGTLAMAGGGGLILAEGAGLTALLWLLVGMEQSLVNIPMQAWIAGRVAGEMQGRMYGAHFVWSHLGWLGAYPLAGWLGLSRGRLDDFDTRGTGGLTPHGDGNGDNGMSAIG
ncbi:MAG: hypothetical protein Q6K70_03285 [Thermostichales cyanobacterium DRC_bins_46]